jgi:galactokinase
MLEISPKQGEMAKQTLAILCQKAEHDYAGTPCGIMDQFAVIFGQAGHILQLDCRTQEITPVPMATGAPQLLVANTMVKHALNDGGYKARRQSCEAAAAQLGVKSLRDATLAKVATIADETTLRRARHIVTENQRCQAAANALQQGDWATLGNLLYASHTSLRDDFTVSCPELDLMVEIARSLGPEGGVYGCRMTGGGFGGCCVALVAPEMAAAVENTIRSRYQKETGINPVIFLAEPSAGARVL